MFDSTMVPHFSSGLHQRFVAEGDHLLGTMGNDVLRIHASRSSAYGLAGNDWLMGAEGRNELFGNEGDDHLQGGDRSDVLNGGLDNDVLIGRSGADFLVGGSGRDRLFGHQGNDSLRGESGDDQIEGGTGNDQLDGGAGIDRLYGGQGRDELIDYEGGDRLTGGFGADWFGVGSPLATRASLITDFKVGVDQVKILRLGATFTDLTFQDRNGDTAILDRGKAIAILLNVPATRLSANSVVLGDAQLAKVQQTNLDQTVATQPETTGISTAWWNSDGTLWLGSAGVVDRASQTPVSDNALFGIGSITKPMVAAIVLQLQDEGKLSLEDPLSRWIPNFVKKIPNGDRIIIRQLLNHTSGIRNYTNEPALIQQYTKNPAVIRQTFTTEKLLSYIDGKPAVGKPGSHFFYSNTGYILLGAIVEAVTGTRLVQQLHQRIFDPLGMTHTFYAPQEPVKGRLTESYQDIDGDGQLDALHEGLSWAGAAGGVISTAADLAKFSRALFQGELLAAKTLNAMVQDNVTMDQTNPNSPRYGLGVYSGTQADLGKFQGHNGATIGWRSDMVYYPEQAITKTTIASTSIV